MTEPRPAPTDPQVWPSDLAALVPVYNHAGRVAAVIEALRAAGAPVWCVDDGSDDGSGRIAEDAGACLIVHPHNRGKGAALRSGFAAIAEAGYARVLTVDADGQHLPAAWRCLVAAPAQALGIVIGDRDMRAAPGSSRFGRVFSNFWVRLACGVDPGDAQSGLRIYPLPLSSRLPSRGKRYHFEVEVLVHAVWAGCSLHPIAVPVVYGSERISHFRALADNLATSWAFTRLICRRLLPWPHRRLVQPQHRTETWQWFRQGTSPGAFASAGALGAGLGVAPVPLVPILLAVYVARRLHLNLALVLVLSGMGSGLFWHFWTAAALALGTALLHGPTLRFQEWQAMTAATDSLTLIQFSAPLLGRCLLGASILMALMAGAGFAGFFLFARLWRSQH